MIKSTDCVLIMGRRGCGKSYLCKKIQEMWPRRVIIDSLSEYESQNTVHTFNEFAEKLMEFKNSNLQSFDLVFQFDPESSVSEVEFNHILRVCYYFGNIQIVIEEVQLYSGPHTLPHWLKQCLLTGRHQNLSLIFTTQRPGELNKTIVSQCSHIFCGSILEGNDLRYISSFLNQDAQRLVQLPDRKFLYFSSQGVQEISNDF